MRAKTRVLSAVLLTGLGLVVAEAGAFVSLRVLQGFKPAQFLVYGPPPITAAEYAEYLEIRDPRLGWPSPRDIGGERFDPTGSRRSPAFPEPGAECVSAYGDSFTYGEEVEAADAWSNVLSTHLGCRVANFGVPGYGTDQAYLRFKYNSADRAPVTMLGIYAQDVLRNVGQYLYLQFGENPRSFKPRFVLHHGELKLVPIPRIEKQDLPVFLNDPGRYLTDECFLPDTQFGPSRLHFPYSAVLLNVLLKDRVSNWLLGRPSWINFMKTGHPSQALEVTAEIVQQFETDCQARRKRCFVTLFPTPASYELYQTRRILAFEALTNMKTRRDVEYLDLTPRLDRYLGDRSYCELLTQQEVCAGHYNPEGNSIVARLVLGYINDESLLK